MSACVGGVEGYYADILRSLKNHLNIMGKKEESQCDAVHAGKSAWFCFFHELISFNSSFQVFRLEQLFYKF